jgi:hypothetical protein
MGWPLRLVSAELRLPAKPSLVVLSIKSAPLAWWWAGPLPPDIGLIYLPFPADPRWSMMVDCVVMSKSDAKHWIVLEHSGGENDGVSTVGWDGPARHRFRGTPPLQAVDLVEPHLDEATRKLLPEISITNIERVLNTPEARDHLGVELAGTSSLIRSRNRGRPANTAGCWSRWSCRGCAGCGWTRSSRPTSPS